MPQKVGTAPSLAKSALAQHAAGVCADIAAFAGHAGIDAVAAGLRRQAVAVRPGERAAFAFAGRSLVGFDIISLRG
jgi:hypothetical protein